MENLVWEIEGLDPAPVPCAVRRSERARLLRLKVFPDGKIELVVPRFVSLTSARDFLERRKNWLRNARIEMIRKNAGVKKTANKGFPETIEFRFLEKTAKTQYLWKPSAWTGCRLDENGNLEFSGNILDPTRVENAFADFLKRTAAEEFPVLLEELSKQIKIPFAKCSVRIQARRWGSCSGRGSISLNALLLLFPRPLVEYVMIHELCHLREMNHSERFWNEVASFLPSWRERRSALNREAKHLPPAFLRLE